MKRKVISSILTLLLVFTMAAPAYAAQAYDATANSQENAEPASSTAFGSARVNVNTLHLRSRASTSSSIIGHLHLGDRVSFTRQAWDSPTIEGTNRFIWVTVISGQNRGAVGWVAANHLNDLQGWFYTFGIELEM